MKISYITLHGVAERIKVTEGDRDTLTLSFTPECDGAVMLGGKAFAVKGGETIIPAGALADGEYRPRLETDGGIFIAEGFIKRGK